MRIVTIRTLHQALVHPVMKRTVELLFLVQVARVAQRRLRRFFQQEFLLFGVVRIVAVRAAYAVLQMHGTREIPMLFAVLVAVETARGNFLRRGPFKREDLRLVSAPVDVRLPRTVASFAAMPLRPFFLVERRRVVR